MVRARPAIVSTSQKEEQCQTVSTCEEEKSPGAMCLRDHAWEADAAPRMVERLIAGLAHTARENMAIDEAWIVRVDSSLEMFLPELPAPHRISSGCLGQSAS